MKPRVVITGVAGFIGSNLAERLLKEGYCVVGIDNLAYGVKEQIPSGVEFHELDIRSPDLAEILCEGDVIFHLAAKNCISDCQDDPVQTADINVTGTVHVLESARRKGVQRIIYAESSALYEGSSKIPTPESELTPLSFYGISKLASRFFAETYQRFYGLKLTALRYFCVYGPRQDYRRTIPPLMSALIFNLLQGRCPTIYGTGKKRRDFIYVDDVNDFHLLCLQDSRTESRAFNIGSGVNHSVQEIFDATEKILQTGLRPIYKPDLSGEAEETLGDITLAKSLGWQPRVPLGEGIRRSIDYFQRHVLPIKIAL